MSDGIDGGLLAFIEARITEEEQVADAAGRNEVGDGSRSNPIVDIGNREWHAIDLCEEGIILLAGPDDGDPGAGFSYHPPRNEQTAQITANSPAATLRQVAGLRAALASFRHYEEREATRQRRLAATGLATDGEDVDSVARDQYQRGLLFGLQCAAQRWSNHPDFKPEWADLGVEEESE